MKQIGELVHEAIDAMGGGRNEAAFAAMSAAVMETLKKTLETDALSNHDYQTFIKQHWRLLAFMGLPRSLPMSREVDSEMKKIVHGFHLNGAEELTVHLVRQTAAMGMPPPQFKFHPAPMFEIKDKQIFIPRTLIGGLIGIVIFQPANKNESVPDNYWINVSDFKMFISELWGRMDLAERIMNL